MLILGICRGTQSQAGVPDSAHVGGSGGASA